MFGQPPPGQYPYEIRSCARRGSSPTVKEGSARSRADREQSSTKVSTEPSLTVGLLPRLLGGSLMILDVAFAARLVSEARDLITLDLAIQRG